MKSIDMLDLLVLQNSLCHPCVSPIGRQHSSSFNLSTANLYQQMVMYHKLDQLETVSVASNTTSQRQSSKPTKPGMPLEECLHCGNPAYRPKHYENS